MVRVGRARPDSCARLRLHDQHVRAGTTDRASQTTGAINTSVDSSRLQERPKVRARTNVYLHTNLLEINILFHNDTI